MIDNLNIRYYSPNVGACLFFCVFFNDNQGPQCSWIGVREGSKHEDREVTGGQIMQGQAGHWKDF